MASRSHTFSEIEPEFGVGDAVHTPIFIGHVGQHGAAEFAVFLAQGKSGEIAGKRFNVVEVVLCVFAEVIAGEFTGGPCFIKRVAEKIIFCDTGVKLLEEFLGRHSVSWRIGTLYEGGWGGDNCAEMWKSAP